MNEEHFHKNGRKNNQIGLNFHLIYPTTLQILAQSWYFYFE
jgi:hypothetical protein